jgi:uncharacterized protein YdiU (UPF0061 family)
MRQLHIAFDNSYARLPEEFFARLPPTPVAQPRLIKFNHTLAGQLGLGTGSLDAQTLASIFSGNTLLPGSEPIAMAYAGHQFGHFVPQLGDGRALLLGEVLDTGGRRRDIQLKGSGRTPFSRGGDGRAALGPVLREYLVSEAMHALGVPATRALAAVGSGDFVFREGRLPGAIVTRVAASHVRVGTFQYFAARGETASTKRLADYVIDRHYPEVRSAAHPYLQLLRSVTQRQARLVSGWMHVGFIHGVMNTDNMTVSGETIDFGPCAFMDAYDPATVFSSIDRMGRYAYANQPPAAQWNLSRFAETLLPLIDPDSERAIQLAGEVLAAFSGFFDEYWLAGMRAKLGLFTQDAEDLVLIRGLLDVMQRSQADFTLTFRGLSDAAENAAADTALQTLFANPREYDGWARTWRSRLDREPQSAVERATAMRCVNPAFIPRNHRIEQAIAAAVERDDYAPFEELSLVLSRPFEERDEFAAYARAPQPEERVLQTFCGT